MSKSLSILQTIAKVTRIVCKVLFILCIIGAVGSLIGLVAIMAFGPLAEAMGAESMDLGVLGCVTGLIACVGEAVFFRLAERYCEHELEAGTPFTQAGAKEILRLGIASLIISVSIAVLCSMASGIFAILHSGFSDMDVSASVSIETGLFLLLLSVIFRYGAETREEAQAPKIEWEPLWETPAKEEPKAESAPAEEKPAEEASKTAAEQAATEGAEQASTQTFDVL